MCRFGVTQSAISKALAKMELTRKITIRYMMEPSEEQKPAVCEKRQTVTADALVDLDECGILQNLYRESGWGPQR